MMGENILLRDRLKHILCEVFENYSIKKINVTLEKSGFQYIKEFVVEFLEENIPGFIRSEIKLELDDVEKKLLISSKDTIYKIEFDFDSNWSTDNYYKETVQLVDYIVNLEKEKKDCFFKKAIEKACKNIEELYALYIIEEKYKSRDKKYKKVIEEVEEEPVQEPEVEKVEEDPVQEPEVEKVEEEPVQEPEVEKVEEAPVQELEIEKVEEEQVQELEVEKVEEEQVQELEVEKIEEEVVQELEIEKSEEPVQKLEIKKIEEEPAQETEIEKIEEELVQEVEIEKEETVQELKIEEKPNIRKLRIVEDEVELIEGKDDVEIMSTWIYNLMTPNIVKAENLNKVIKGINVQINNEMINNYLRDILSKPENISVDYFSPKKDFYKLVLFEDLLSVDYKNLFTKKLAFDFNYIKDWFKDKIVPEFKDQYGEDFVKELNINIKEYETVDFYGENFKKIKDCIKEVVEEQQAIKIEEDKRYLQSEHKDLQKKVEQIDVSKINDIYELSDKFNELQFKYDENKYVLANKYSERLIEIIDEGNVEMSIKELNQFLNRNKPYFNEKVYIYMQVYLQKEIQKLVDKTVGDLEAVNTLQELGKIQEEILANGEFVICRDIEELLMQKFEEIVKKLNIEEINNEENIELGIKIYNKNEIVDLSEYEIASVLIDREIVVNLDNIKESIEEMLDTIYLIKDIVVKNCMFNYNYYNLDIVIKDKTYTIKFKYLQDLVDYIKVKNGHSLLVKIKSISSKNRYKNRIFLRGNKDIVSALDSIYDKSEK